MTLILYNTLTRCQEVFEPLELDTVRMYCCGVTVYDYCHLGHARSYIVWDVVRRYLTWRGYRVHYVQNFTDIDDKILNRARTEQSSMKAVAQKFTQAYFEDMARLNILEATEYTYATHTIDGIQRLIHELEDKGYAYAAGGDVYYRVRKFADYGKLSGRKLDDLQAGASGRVKADDSETKKADPFDFALWKAAKPGEVDFWESPWGKGRPGWHIECSAMVRERLGDAIDIHVGGADLIFPHHENEIAQSEAATGKPLARYWLHNGMVNVNGEKMSKSLGNFTTIRQMLDDRHIDPMVLRLLVLQTHYLKPIDFTDDAIVSAQNSWQTLKEGLLFQHLKKDDTLTTPNPDLVQDFNAAMDNDFNTPAGLSVLFRIAKELRREKNLLVHQGTTETDLDVLVSQWHTLIRLAEILGLYAEPEAELIPDATGFSEADIEQLIHQRQAARKSKNFAEGDRIRDQLKAAGITLIDSTDGTRWHRE